MMRVYTLIDGSILILADDARSEYVPKHLTIENGDASQEIRRLEEYTQRIRAAIEKLAQKDKTS